MRAGRRGAALAQAALPFELVLPQLEDGVEKVGVVGSPLNRKAWRRPLTKVFHPPPLFWDF